MLDKYEIPKYNIYVGSETGLFKGKNFELVGFKKFEISIKI